MLDVASEHRIAITGNQVGEAMEPDDGIKKTLSNHSHHVRVALHDEVGVLQEPVDVGQNDTLAMNTQKTLDEDLRNERPHLRWNIKRLEETV